MLLNEY